MRSMCRIRPDMSRMDVGDGHGNGPQPRPPMNQLGHVVLRVRYRPENLIDGIQDARLSATCQMSGCTNANFTPSAGGLVSILGRSRRRLTGVSDGRDDLLAAVQTPPPVV